jgi:hypothetical protein
MDDIENFRRKVRARVDAAGPCCSCLATIIILLLGMLFMLERCH